MADGSDQRKRGRKFDQVRDGAREVFLSAGFEGANVDDIARVAGVSKATIYSYFPDKRLMFMEVVRFECQRQSDSAIAAIDMAAPVRDLLLYAARTMLAFMTSDFGQRIFRICVAESERFPELAQNFYDSGPAVVRNRLTEFFAEATARGDLVIDDLDLAADQFHALCKADIFDRMVFAQSQTFTPAEMTRVAEGAVSTFLARYGAR